jgi:hypothetical protein
VRQGAGGMCAPYVRRWLAQDVEGSHTAQVIRDVPVLDANSDRCTINPHHDRRARETTDERTNRDVSARVHAEVGAKTATPAPEDTHMTGLESERRGTRSVPAQHSRSAVGEGLNGKRATSPAA